MLNWKLLSDLLPSELKLECERAGIAVSPKESLSVIRLSKYIMSSGYDPESFYFNTHYQADKTHPLLGMTSAAGFHTSHAYNGHARVSPAAAATKLTSSPARPTTSVPLPQREPGPSSRSDDVLLQMLERMSLSVEKMVTLMEAKKSGAGLDGDRHEVESSCPDLPYWDSSEFDGSFGSSEISSLTSSKYSSVSNSSDRKYNKSMLIRDGICLAFQHGNCPDQYEDKHVNAYGQKLIHFCGLCWTDSPDNQCYNPANQCPGQYYYC